MTLNQYALVTRIQQDASLASLTDAQVAALPGFASPVLTPVPYATFQSGMMQLACWGAIRVAQATGLASFPAAQQAAILTAIDLLTSYKAPTVDMSLPAFTTAMSTLEAANLVSSSDAAAILAMGQVYTFGGPVQTADVTPARQIAAGLSADFDARQRIDAGYQAEIALQDTYVAALWANPATAVAPTNAQLNAASAAKVGS